MRSVWSTSVAASCPPSPAAIQVVPFGVSTAAIRHGLPTQVTSVVEARTSPVSRSSPSSDACARIDRIVLAGAEREGGRDRQGDERGEPSGDRR